jgi:8-hydroxy-5-deazaflavin:NADPH oxidoreductase
MKIGIIGAGNVARHLGTLFLRSGHDVALGRRTDAPAPAGAPYRTMSLEQVVAHGDVIVLAVPFGALTSVLPPLAHALAGKVVVDATNPVHADWSPQLLGAENSAAEEVARLVPEARVVKAFNTVFADVMTPEYLVRAGQRVTAFVAGDHPSANEVVASLASGAGFAPLIVGVLAKARHLEALAHLNIAIAVGGGGTNAAFVYHQA